MNESLKKTLKQRHKMKLEKIKEERKKNKLSFLLKDSDEVFANTIRRIILEEVPTLAVEEVEIKENSSALYDEMLALRIGLIPIKTDLKSYELKEKCSCKGEGCACCELKITLKANKKGYVYAEEAESTDPKCTFAYPKMPIVKLLSKQKVDLSMTAVLERGQEHTKWAPGLVYYKKEPILKIKGKVANPVLLAKSCPQNVFNVKGEKLELNSENIYNCHLCQQCLELDKNITLEESNNFVFYVESWGQLSCKEMLEQSAEILLEKIEEMEKLI